ncbi:ABC transporter substrate-binding protein [Ideonella sp. YS5]|uniref:ABC transporter substrate-binding protein n=1 Tax=Ideonella sp. YS5 TaxID=3453714 RepID=UPI003EEF566A
MRSFVSQALACLLPFLAFTAHGQEAIVIGQSAPFSGPSAQLATEFNLGARTYFQMVNEGGGIHGRRIELKALDDAYDSSVTVRNTTQLVEKDHVLALFGYVGTSTTLAALPIATAAQVPFIAPVSGAEALRSPFNRMVFNLRASYLDEAQYIVDQLAVSGLKSIAVLYQNDAYGKAGLEALATAQKKRGETQLVGSATVERHSTDVAAQAKTLLASHAQAVVLISSYSSSAALIKEMKKSGYSGQFVSVSFGGGKALADELGSQGTGVMISEVTPFAWGESLQIQREYTKALRKANVPAASFGSMEGFLAAKVLVEGLQRAGRDLTRARLVAALESMGNWDAGGVRISFSPDNHNGSHFVEMTMIGPAGRFVH